MSLKIVIMVAAVVAVVQGQGFGFFGNDDNVFPGFPMFPMMNFPPIPMIPMPVIPDPSTLKNIKPGQGQMFTGIAMTSTSGMTTDKDGNIVQTGGTTVLTNNNGDVKEYSTGNAPPKLQRIKIPILPIQYWPIQIPVFEPIEMPEMPEMEPFKMPKMPKMNPFKMPEMPKMKPLKFDDFDDFEEKPKKKMPKKYREERTKPWKFPKMKPLVFKPIVIPPMDTEKIKNYKPSENEHYVGYSKSTYSHSKDINGVKSSGGGSNTVVNVDGKVEQQSVVVGEHDKPKKATKPPKK